MNNVISSEDVIGVAKAFCDCNANDADTVDLILAIAAELLDVSVDTVAVQVFGEGRGL